VQIAALKLEVKGGGVGGGAGLSFLLFLFIILLSHLQPLILLPPIKMSYPYGRIYKGIIRKGLLVPYKRFTGEMVTFALMPPL
jgi:hypothetical protein